MIDCLIIGYNERDFAGYVSAVRSTGTDGAAFRDLNRGFIDFQGKPHRCQDLLNHFYWQGRPEPHGHFHNFDFLAPVILYLGSYLTRRGFTFDYVNLFHLEKEKLAEKLRSRRYRTIAITTTFYVTADPVLDIVSFLRRHGSDAKIVVGGPHVAYTEKQADAATLQYLFRYMGADFYVISSEGELALARLLTALAAGEGFDDIDNLAYRRGEEYVLTARSTEANVLAEEPVDYSLFSRDELGEMVSLRTAKSCPFNCSFCDFPQFAGKYRYSSVAEVERELDHLAELGTVSTLTFLDDTFNVPKKRFKELLRMMIRRRYGFRWNCFYRADHGDAEIIDLMAEAGCEGVFMGIESASDRMLAVMNKHARRSDYSAAIPHLKAVGIVAYASLIVGFPGETEETVQESIDFLEEVRPDYYLANIWYCHPVTPIYQKREELELRGSAYNWSHSTMDSRTAADHAERMFLAVEGSTWLPCDLWSVFYLQRQGMTRSQITAYVRCFNALVKEKLLAPARPPRPELMESLSRACRFDRPAAPDLELLRPLAGDGYRAAEEFWLGELARSLPAEVLAALGGGEEGAASEAWERLAVSAGSEGVEALAAASGADAPAVLLGALAFLLASESGGAGVAVLAATEDGWTLPLWLAAPGRPLSSWVEEAAGRLAAAHPHRRYGLYLARHASLLDRRGIAPPSFEVGFVLRDGGGRHRPSDGLGLPEPEERRVGVALEAERVTGGTRLALAFRPGRLRRPTAAALAVALSRLLSATASPRRLAPGAGALANLSDRAALQRRAVERRHRQPAPGRSAG